ncbi:MAG: MarR family transcriptional regulator [Nitrososphaerota archaeon]|nr:MarR family transcriptional regulator [Nitrososphaerota archaeon]
MNKNSQRKDSIEINAWRKIGSTYRTLYSYINSDLRPYGLTPPQYTVMRIIGTSQKGTMMSDIGNNMVVTFANVTTIVDNLEKMSYVKRVRDPSDRRRIIVELTAQGKNIFRKIHEKHSKVIEDIMRALSEQDLKNLIEYLEKLKNSVA